MNWDKVESHMLDELIEARIARDSDKYKLVTELADALMQQGSLTFSQKRICLNLYNVFCIPTKFENYGTYKGSNR